MRLFRSPVDKAVEIAGHSQVRVTAKLGNLTVSHTRGKPFQGKIFNKVDEGIA
jgi:hypothetical protein